MVTQFGGSPVKTFTYASGAVTPTERIDLSSLKSGVYNLWLEVDDGRNTPSRKYFPGEVAVEHPWAETWPGNTAVTPALGGLNVSWAPNANTDVDGYELRIVEQTADPYNDDIYVVDVGDGLSQTVSGLSAKSAYSVTVVAYDTGTGSESTGGTAAGTPLRAPFSAVAQPAAVNAIGGNPVNAGVRVASSIAPYPGQVFLTVEDVSDGLEAEFVSEQITPTVAGVLAGLVVTPDASLPSGLYTVTVSAASSGDVTRIEIPVNVSARDFSLQADAAVAINTGGAASVAVGTSAINGESNAVSYDVEDMPDGIDWAFAQSDVAAGLGTQLHLTATEYALPGTYTVTVVATDRDHTHIKTLALSVNGFGLATDWDSYATATGVSVTFGARLEGAGWTAPAALSIDPTSAGGHFSIVVPASANVPAAREHRRHAAPGHAAGRLRVDPARGQQRRAQDAAAVCDRAGECRRARSAGAVCAAGRSAQRHCRRVVFVYGQGAQHQRERRRKRHDYRHDRDHHTSDAAVERRLHGGPDRPGLRAGHRHDACRKRQRRDRMASRR